MTLPSERAKYYKQLAPILLALLVLLFIGLIWLDSSSLWLKMIRSSAEAGIVGGLVDWFAVVAIFRHPLGIPIPYTAVIRKGKDRLADGIYAFIIDNFSDPNRASKYVKDSQPSRHFSYWLSQPKNADAAANIIVNSVRSLLPPKRNRRVRFFLATALVAELKRQNIAPLLGRILDHVYRRRDHHKILDFFISSAEQYIEANPQMINEKISKRSPWFLFGLLDEVIAENVEQGLLDKLKELRKPDDEIRQKFDLWLESKIEELKQGRFEAKTLMTIWRELVSNEDMRSLIEGVWDDIRSEVLDYDGINAWKLKQKLSNFLQRLGKLLNEDPELQREIDARLANVAMGIAGDVVDGAGKYIGSAIRSWRANDVADKLEAAVGKELQYIRINGTVLGCLVGLLLFWLVEIVS